MSLILNDTGGGGGGGGLTSFEFTQSSPSAVWVIQHNLGKNPVNITVSDSTGTKCQVQTHFDSINQVTLTFSGAESGRAVCS